VTAPDLTTRRHPIVRERAVRVRALGTDPTLKTLPTPAYADTFFAAGTDVLRPAIHAEREPNEHGVIAPLAWIDLEGERVAPFRIATRPICNAEVLAFVHDRGYTDRRLWSEDGFDTVMREHWRAPLYWARRDGMWVTFDVAGMQELDPAETACHLSYYEAEAIARWAQARLPTEAEWALAGCSPRQGRSRTFFAPSARWQMTGVRLASDRGAP
jgi:hypothetical protein